MAALNCLPKQGHTDQLLYSQRQAFALSRAYEQVNGIFTAQ